MQWICRMWELMGAVTAAKIISTVKSKALEDKLFKPASAIVNEVCVALNIILFLSTLNFLAAEKKKLISCAATSQDRPTFYVKNFAQNTHEISTSSWLMNAYPMVSPC